MSNFSTTRGRGFQSAGFSNFQYAADHLIMYSEL